MMTIDGYILAGGESRRMGTPKSNLRLGGFSLIERAGYALQNVCGRIFVVGKNSSDHRFLKLDDTEDLPVLNRRGAIIGLYTALLNCRAAEAAILACDLPFVTPKLFEHLAEISSTFPEADAVIPVQPDGRLQPLCAIYRTDVCLPMIRSALDSGDWRLQEAVARLNIRHVEFSEIAHLERSENFFFNLNTTADYEAAAALAVRSDEISSHA